MPVNGGFKCSDGSYFNSRCEFFCSPGYYLKGQKTTTCQHTKLWTAEESTCIGESVCVCVCGGSIMGGLNGKENLVLLESMLCELSSLDNKEDLKRLENGHIGFNRTNREGRSNPKD